VQICAGPSHDQCTVERRRLCELVLRQWVDSVLLLPVALRRRHVVRWAVDDLVEECTRRALAVKGSSDKLRELLERDDEQQAGINDERQAPPHKRKAVDEDDRLASEKRLLRACARGSFFDVRQVLSSNDIDVNCKMKGNTPLLVACIRRDDWSVAEAIVRELLTLGAVVDDGSEPTKHPRNMRLPIHMAARFSSCAIVTMLIEANSPVHSLAGPDVTPLLACCVREDEDEAVSIAQVFLDHGGGIEPKDTAGATPLIVAARHGSGPLVEFLLSRGADVHA
jgi:hypothetical protein